MCCAYEYLRLRRNQTFLPQKWSIPMTTLDEAKVQFRLWNKGRKDPISPEAILQLQEIRRPISDLDDLMALSLTAEGAEIAEESLKLWLKDNTSGSAEKARIAIHDLLIPVG